MLNREKIVRITLLSISILASAVLMEVVLRIVFPEPKEYFLWPPHTQRIFRVSSRIMPGIEGESRFITNSKGILADEVTPDCTYKILTVGGSTTECLYVDQEKRWPYLLQKSLNEEQHNYKVWVGNVAKSGMNTRDHIIELRCLLKLYPDIDAVILLVGINDLLLRLAQDSNYNPNFLNNTNAEQEIFDRVFINVRYKRGPYYRRTAIWQLLRKVKMAIFPPTNFQDEAGKAYIKWRSNRRHAVAIRRTLPDLSSALDEYARNINTIINLANSKSIRVIFITQPVLWKSGLSERLNDLLWFGGVGDYQNKSGKEYYSIEVLSAAMAIYNETLLKTCRARHVECIDLAPILPKDTTVFYDDAHFNDSGTKKVAAIITGYLMQSNLISKNPK